MEKNYKLLGRTGGMNIAIGVLVMVVGIVSGILLIIGGSKIISAKSKMLI